MNCFPCSFPLLFFTGIMVYFDVRYKKMPNKLILPFLFLGLAGSVWVNGLNGLSYSFLGITAGTGLLLLPYIWGWVGGGDVKFLAAAGSFLGPLQIAYAAFWGLILFGVAAFLFLIIKKRLRNFLYQVYILLTLRSLKGFNQMEVSGSMPLGLFLGLGISLNWIYSLFL